MWYHNQRRHWLLNPGLKKGGGRGSDKKRGSGDEKGGCINETTTMGYSSGDMAAGERIETVCRVWQTNGAAPCGKEIIMGSVSVKHVNTIQKGRRGGVRWGRVGWGGLRARGSAAASRGPQGPGLATATLALPKNVCNPRVDWGDPELSPAMQRGSLLSAALKEEMGGSQRGAEGGGGQDQGRWCPFLSQALWELPAIVQKLQLHFSDLLCTPVDSGYWLSSWTWKGYDPHL